MSKSSALDFARGIAVQVSVQRGGARWIGVCALALILGQAQASPALSAPALSAPALSPTDPNARSLSLSAAIGTTNLAAGLSWEVFPEVSPGKGPRTAVARSTEAHPTFVLPEGRYIVHAAYGLAGVTKTISLVKTAQFDTLVLTAGALRIVGILGDQAILPSRETIAIYVPQPDNAEAKLVVKNAHPGDVIGLPEGIYHLVSTYLDTVGVGSLNAVEGGIPTNSVINADIRVPNGKFVEVTLRHHAATVTLKLVKEAGTAALANTSFTVLTPGGDVIRELVGAYPSLVLGEGEYVVIARRDGKTYQSTLTVQSAIDRDAEILAK